MLLRFQEQKFYGETAATYTPPTDQVGTLYYFCEVTQTEEGCSVYSELAQITVVPSPVISSQPVPDSVCVNGFIDALFVEFEEGVGAPSYQWFSNSIPSIVGATQLLGETGAAYTPPTDAIGTTWYTVVLNLSEGVFTGHCCVGGFIDGRLGRRGLVHA